MTAKNEKVIGYYAQISARSGVLLGGVKVHRSSSFERKEDAEVLGETMVEINKSAHRDVQLDGVFVCNHIDIYAPDKEK